LEGNCGLNGVQIFPLNVFDQRDFEKTFVGNFLNRCWDLGQPGESGRAPSSLTGYELKPIGGFANDERLNDSVSADRLREFGEFLLIEEPPGLQGIGVNEID
jgi:hypothetical protein